MSNKTEWQETVGVFPIPVYVAKSNSDLTSKEEIEKVIQQGMKKNTSNSTSMNTYIFDENFKELKEFIEEHIKKYVEDVIHPREELDFYITQSWLTLNKPGESLHSHCHANSIISGVFYVSVPKNDHSGITFVDPNFKIREVIKFEQKGFTPWNSTSWFFPVNNNELILFPSWLHHRVDPNENATIDRISIAFNVFVKGVMGETLELTELILK